MKTSALNWCCPPTQVSLPADEVHVWRAFLDRPLASVESLLETLSDEERDRASRYHCTAKRGRFVVGRGLLRTILARYLGIKPRLIAFRIGSMGKPVLDTPSASLHFNVSHSHELVLVAITRRGEVGIDVERVRPFANSLDLAERYFSPGECQTLNTLAPERRTEAFFHAWTRKEACLKALGAGISYGLDRVEVTICPEEPVRLVRLDGEERRAAPWSLRALVPAPGYVGALALQGQGFHVIGWHWPED
jgi:4'-phosphopantetheinyl transferase